MAQATIDPSIDPNFRDYAYAAHPKVVIYKRPDKKAKAAAVVFLGEWLKILKSMPSEWVHVKFRGGKGYVRAEDLTPRRHLEIFFIDVGQGDAILIQTPDDRRILIDGGMTDDAYDFIRTKYCLDDSDNYTDFEAVIATHSDQDHTKGLFRILRDPKIAVKRVYHNGLFRRTNKKNDPGTVRGGRVFGLVEAWPANQAGLTPTMRQFVAAVKKARDNLPKCLKAMANIPRWDNRIDFKAKDFVFRRLDAGNRYLPPYDQENKYVTVEVLWPSARKIGGKLSYPWYSDAGHTVNGNSVVLAIQHGRNRILLTGDLNEESMDGLLDRYGKAARRPLRAEVYKAAHHGSQHFSLPFLRAVRPNAAVISSGDDRKDQHGHPRAVLLGTITRHSRCRKPAVFSTELAACFSKLSQKERKQFHAGRKILYERAIQGTVQLRSNGKELYLGTVHGKKAPKDRHAQIVWKWDIWPE